MKNKKEEEIQTYAYAPERAGAVGARKRLEQELKNLNDQDLLIYSSMVEIERFQRSLPYPFPDSIFRRFRHLFPDHKRKFFSRKKF